MQDTSKEYYEIENVKTQEKNRVEKVSAKKDLYDIFNIDPYQFSQLYNNKIVPALISTQETSKNERSGVNLATSVYLLLICGFSFFDILMWIAVFTEKQTENKRAALISAILFLIPIIFLPFMLSKVEKVDRYALKEKFFSFFNIKYSRYTYVERCANKAYIYGKSISEKISKAMEKMAISFLKYNADESLDIPYKGRTLELLELNTRFSSESLLIVSYFINKKFKGETVVKSISKGAKSSFSSKQEVHLEDPAFNDNFKIFADDQVEARYLLTTAFMERLLNFQKRYNCTASVLFDNSISQKSNVFLSLSFGKDFFEIPKGKRWIEDSSYFYTICQEIRGIAYILDALKLDQDIGM
jgi:Protein of unknown function (DUF3137).